MSIVVINSHGRSSLRLPRLQCISRCFLIALGLLCAGSLLTSIASAADASARADPAASPKASLPKVVVVGKRMTEEQKRQFDDAEAVAAKAAANKLAGLQQAGR